MKEIHKGAAIFFLLILFTTCRTTPDSEEILSITPVPDKQTVKRVIDAVIQDTERSRLVYTLFSDHIDDISSLRQLHLDSSLILRNILYDYNVPSSEFIQLAELYESERKILLDQMVLRIEYYKSIVSEEEHILLRKKTKKVRQDYFE